MNIVHVDEDIWTLDGDSVSMYTIPFQTRMTVVRLANGKLWLHSPVAISPERVDAVRALGDVTYIVAPNSLHYLFVTDWASRFPGARVWLTPDLPGKLPQLTRYDILEDEADPAWRETLDQSYFRGSALLTEVFFLHRSSGTLIVTDVIQNHDPKRNNWFWKLIKRLNGVLAPSGGVPKDLRLTMRARDQVAASVERVLEWDFRRIVMSHGHCIESDAKAFFRSSFGWLED